MTQDGWGQPQIIFTVNKTNTKYFSVKKTQTRPNLQTQTIDLLQTREEEILLMTKPTENLLMTKPTDYQRARALLTVDLRCSWLAGVFGVKVLLS